MDSQCGDWERYKDEKDFKIFGKVGTEEDAGKEARRKTVLLW